LIPTQKPNTDTEVRTFKVYHISVLSEIAVRREKKLGGYEEKERRGAYTQNRVSGNITCY
jgi:hypothetical protein